MTVPLVVFAEEKQPIHNVSCSGEYDDAWFEQNLMRIDLAFRHIFEVQRSIGVRINRYRQRCWVQRSENNCSIQCLFGGGIT